VIQALENHQLDVLAPVSSAAELAGEAAARDEESLHAALGSARA
jgi:hypothetical protein